jgi:hypothetical protein
MEIILPIIAFVISLFFFITLIVVLKKLIKIKHLLTIGVLIGLLHFIIVVFLGYYNKNSCKNTS